MDRRKDDNNDYNFDYTINISNNIFKENRAENYGGAIYSEIYTPFSSISSSKENEFQNNKAGVLGGAIYTQNSREYNILDIEQNSFINNTANDYANNYNSKPSYILLNSTFDEWDDRITSGDYLPMMFVLYDEYDNIMEINDYYYNIIMKATLEKKYKQKGGSPIIETYYLTGNMASFISGM